MARLIDDAVAGFGRLDTLLNNAGVETRALLWEVTVADYDSPLGITVDNPDCPIAEWRRQPRPSAFPLPVY